MEFVLIIILLLVSDAVRISSVVAVFLLFLARLPLSLLFLLVGCCSSTVGVALQLLLLKLLKSSAVEDW